LSSKGDLPHLPLEVEEMLGKPVRLWEHFPFEGPSRADPLLQEDLPNHFKDLAKMLENVETSSPRAYPQFLQAAHDLLFRRCIFLML